MKKKKVEEKKLEKKDTKKEVVSKKKDSKKNRKLDFNKIYDSEKLLLGVFILLAIIVCILGCFVIKERNNRKVTNKANVVLPIIDLGSKNTIKIDAYGLTKERFYIIKVTNYRDKKINKNELEYSIDVENNTKAVIKLTKNDDQTNLIKNNLKTVITGQKLNKDNKQEDYYYVSIVHDGGVVKDNFITITFNS